MHMFRVDEMAKILEEERLLEQQHYEAEQNKQALVDAVKKRGGHFALTHQGSLSDLSDFNTSQDDFKYGFSKPKFWRWPSLGKIKELKEKLGVSG